MCTTLYTGTLVRLVAAQNSGDLFTSLSMERNSVSRSMRAVVNVICYEFETHDIKESFILQAALVYRILEQGITCLY